MTLIFYYRTAIAWMSIASLTVNQLLYRRKIRPECQAGKRYREREPFVTMASIFINRSPAEDYESKFFETISMQYSLWKFVRDYELFYIEKPNGTSKRKSEPRAITV